MHSHDTTSEQFQTQSDVGDDPHTDIIVDNTNIPADDVNVENFHLDILPDLFS